MNNDSFYKKVHRNILRRHKFDEANFDINNNCIDFQHLLGTYCRHVRPSDIVIEIGASNQYRTRSLAKSCRKLIGVEYYTERLPCAYKNIRYKLGNWEQLTQVFKENSFDILISSQTIEHISNDLAAIKETYKVLKPGGVAIINTPNRRRLIRRFIEFFSGPRKFPWWEHVREYSKQDLMNLIRKSPFRKYEIIPICFGIKPLRWMCFRNCPKLFEDFCIHWEVILYK